MKRNILVVLLVISMGAHAQVFTVKTLKDTTNSGMSFTFPLIQSTVRADAARKINEHLRMKELNLANASQSNTFDHLKKNDDIVEYDFIVLANTEKVFTVHFTGKSCPRLCLGYNTYYSFDSRTGNPITANQLFSEGSFAKLMKLMLPEYKERIKASFTEGSDYAGEYRECQLAADALEEFPFSLLYLLENELAIGGGQCLDPAASQQMDDVYRKPLEKIWWSLSAYGLSFFIEPPAANVSTNVILRGKIDGKYAFAMLLFPGVTGNATDVHGYEVYNKYGQNILINGRISGKEVVLNELDAKEQPQATFTGTWDGKKMTGTFKNLKTNKVMPFVCER